MHRLYTGAGVSALAAHIWHPEARLRSSRPFSLTHRVGLISGTCGLLPDRRAPRSTGRGARRASPGQIGLALFTAADRSLRSITSRPGIAPKDELEGMMAAQLVAAHNAAMECYRRAMIGEQTFEGRRENLAQANKLSRTYAALLEALNRHRGKGQQKVTVEHVHVHAGGQAVVGMVATPGQPGGGDRSNLEEQSHAKQIAHAPQPAMPEPGL
jgi:hypothetical protein